MVFSPIFLKNAGSYKGSSLIFFLILPNPKPSKTDLLLKFLLFQIPDLVSDRLNVNAAPALNKSPNPISTPKFELFDWLVFSGS